MLLQPKQMLAQVFEGRHRADPTTASASSDSAWPQKGTRSPACLWWMHGVSASWMSWSNLRAQWWTTAPGHLHKPFLPLCLSELQPFHIQPVAQDLSETPWFAQMPAAFPSVLRMQFLLCDCSDQHYLYNLLHSAPGATRQNHWHSAVSLGKFWYKLMIHSTSYSPLLVIK